MQSKLSTFFVFSMLFLCSYTLTAQRLSHVLGDVLVQLPQGVTPDALVLDNQQFNKTATQFRAVEHISPPLNIWQLHFDYTTINERDFMKQIWQHKDVEIAQLNHLITHRAVPNDPQFEDQWQYINTGQDGGTAGADIDMELAWDITTGGLTAQGDTIVVCVLDDGLDLDHEDWGDNVWRNHAEIPDNNIDDDNNGYVDDYWGWTSSGNDEIDDFSSHGTPVAGIVGAKGNNGIGVSGVSWDVKVMMMVNDAGDEASIIEGYTYPLVQRQRWNDTDGAEGAFVVVTNSSWGYDFGQPDDSPLWCGFYDTMGEAGILSCGATINGNENVDVVGDLPTACPSDYMISVTNMNRNDNKVTGAGYGLETIDLGAFGQDTWTLANQNGYEGFGGTSGATPHVAGTIGLMYAAPCATFMETVKADPAAGALLMRDYILGGVDANASLEGITTTGGRLNVRNSLDLMMSNCGPCPPPNSLTAEAISDVSVDLVWNNLDGTLSNDLRYREVGTMIWTELTGVSSPLPIDNLLACTEYEFQVSRECDAENSDFSSTTTFLTDGCCDIPEGITLAGTTETSANFTWTGVLAAQNYQVRYRQINTTDWTENTITESSISIDNLTNCTEYELQVATTCDSENTEFGASYFFLTAGCGACTDNEFCEVSGSTEYEFIESISFGSLITTTGNDGGFGAFISGPQAFEAGLVYEVSLTPGFVGDSYEENFGIYIDLDQNGDFEASELLFEASSNTSVTGELIIPTTATEGNTRMRVIMRYEEAVTSCGNLGEGEAEDYCIEITGAGLAPCDPPENLQVTGDAPAQDTNEAFATWDAVAGAAEYTVRFAEIGMTNWQEQTTTATELLLNLEYELNYNIEVKTSCTDGGESDWTTTTFMTGVNSLKDVLPNAIADFKAFPSPFVDNLTVQFQLNENSENVSIEVLNVAGQILQNKALGTISTMRQTQSLDLSQMTAGVYFVRLKSDEWTSTQRVVKMR